jgi:hypothetical protein
MKTDPTDTGGLFVSRRPGTRPIKYRALPEGGSERRRRFDRWVAVALLVLMGFVNLLFYGPVPAGGLWVGSQVEYLTDSMFAGIIAALFVILFALLLGLIIMRRIDSAWILVRRAAGYDQREGVIGRVFGYMTAVAAVIFFAWLFLIAGPGPTFAPST